MVSGRDEMSIGYITYRCQIITLSLPQDLLQYRALCNPVQGPQTIAECDRLLFQALSISNHIKEHSVCTWSEYGTLGLSRLPWDTGWEVIDFSHLWRWRKKKISSALQIGSSNTLNGLFVSRKASYGKWECIKEDGQRVARGGVWSCHLSNGKAGEYRGATGPKPTL